MDANAYPSGRRLLKTSDGTVYGPVDAMALGVWATEARIMPGCSISEDGQTWTPAESVPELRLDWNVGLPDGSSYGPLNLVALWELAQDQSIPWGGQTVNRHTGQAMVLGPSLFPLVIGEARAMLGSAARHVAAAVERAETEGRTRLAPQPDAPKVRELEAELARKEQELAATLKLVGESQKLLANRDETTRALQQQVADRDTRLQQMAASYEDKLREQAEAFQKSRPERDQADLDRQLDELRSESAAQAARLTRAEADRDAALARLRELEQAAADHDQRAGLLNAQVAAMQQTVPAMKADYEARLIAAQEAARTAAAELAEEREDRRRKLALLEEALSGLKTDYDARLKAQDAAHRAAGEDLAREREAHRETQRKLTDSAQAAKTQAAEFEARLGETQARMRDNVAREASRREQAEAGAAALSAELAQAAARLEEARTAHADRESELQRAEEALRAEVRELGKNLEAAATEAAEKNKAVEERDRELLAVREAAAEREQTLTDRLAKLDKDLQTAVRRAEDARVQLEQARKETKEARGSGEAAASRLQGEIKTLQRDLNAMLIVRSAVRQARAEKPTPARAPIDWLEAGHKPETTEAEQAARAGFAALSAPEQVTALQGELRGSIETREQMRREMAKLRAEYEAFEKESRRRLEESVARTEQLRQEAESNARMQQQTLEELEKREGAWRNARKKTDEREKELVDRITVLEAEAARAAPEPVEGEWAHPRGKGPEAPTGAESTGANGAGAAKDGAAGGDTAPHGLLTTVEAQVQSELEQWAQLRKEGGRKGEKAKAWFWRKKS